MKASFDTSWLRCLQPVHITMLPICFCFCCFFLEQAVSSSLKLKGKQKLVVLCSEHQATINQATLKSCRTRWALWSTSGYQRFQHDCGGQECSEKSCLTKYSFQSKSKELVALIREQDYLQRREWDVSRLQGGANLGHLEGE